MICRKSVLALAISSAFLGAPALAQPTGAADVTVSAIETPALRGKVINDRGAFMGDVTVRLDGSNRETVTDSQGNFRFENIPAGSYQVSVDYLGYEPQRATAEVSATRGQNMVFTLAPATLSEIVVYGSSMRDAQARALNAQRVADSIKSILSADYLGRFPDDNVAESMQRLVGASIQRDQGDGRYVNVRGAPLEYSNVSVDGVLLPSPDGGTRAIDLDTIPADVIANLELTKAITPDMDADAIAGNINIVTQGSLDSPERVLRLHGAGGRNEKGSGDNYRAGVTWGDALNEERTMGFLVSANHSENNKVVDNVEHVWSPNDNDDYVVEETEFKDYETKRMRTGVSARFDYAPTENTHLYASHTYSRFEDQEHRDTTIIEWDDFTSDSGTTHGIAQEVAMEKELRNRTVVNTINSTVLGGKHFFANGVEWDYSGAYSESSQKYPDRDYLAYELGYEPAIAYDYSNPEKPRYSVLDTDGNVVRNDFNFSASDYDFGTYERRFGTAEDTEQAYATSLTFPGTMNGSYRTTKIGAKVRLREKYNDEDRRRNSSGDGAPSFADVSIHKQSTPFGGRFNNGPKFDRDFVSKYGPTLENDDYRLRLEASVTGDYEVSEDIYAAYAMQKLEWDRTSMVYGLRVEHTRTQGSAAEFDADEDLVIPLVASNRYTEVFPSLHLRHELENSVILRAAYSTGISRPNFADMAPFRIVEDRSSAAGSIEMGNPDLKPAYAHNIDLLAEYYIEPLGLISGGLFYKDISDPIFTSRSRFQSGEFAGFEGVRPENASNGELYGFELNWQQRMDYLPGYWSGLGFIANYTNTRSSVDLPFGAGTTALAGTSRHTYNLGLQYDTQRFSSQVSYNYRSEYIDSFDTSDPSLHVYWDGRATLDLTASYELNDIVTFRLEATNLTDTQGMRYQGNTGRVYELEQFGRAWLVGINARF